MRKVEIGFISAMILVSIGAMVVATNYPYYGSYGPDSAFFPMWAAGLMLLANIINLVKVLRAPKEEEEKPFFKNAQQRNNLLIFVGALVLLAVGVNFLGILPAGLIYMVCMYRFYDKHPWLQSLLVPVGVVIFFYVMFNIWLKMPLPMGIFE